MEVSLNIHHIIISTAERPFGSLPSDTKRILKEHEEAATLQMVKELVMTSAIIVGEEEETAQTSEESTSPEEEEVPQRNLKEPPQARSIVEENERDERSTGNMSEFETGEQERDESRTLLQMVGYLTARDRVRATKVFIGRNLSWTVGPVVADRETLKIVIEKSFDQSVIKHVELEHLFGGLGWVLLLRLSGDFYPNLVRDFYANMLH
ncbi:hypothetical protein M9H77_21896 [Catharanthus roseus]|uniref:Uncharacterized protein n=1 Tax=Catharanthus roseus TaxID=4058 RepID=A0ACC0AT01_CATRO|nr:hypothetical protein M9H77_21896 [Catharanthus roseus]